MTKLVVLHTNDLHCRFEPFPNTDPKFAGKGGMNRISAYAKALRKVEPQLLMLDCGDFSQGTPYYNFFGSELVLKMMTEMGYDASTIGNHEFDLGLDDLSNAMNTLFPLVHQIRFHRHAMNEKLLRAWFLNATDYELAYTGWASNCKDWWIRTCTPYKLCQSNPHCPRTRRILRTQERCDFIMSFTPWI
jgi:hypothetical protein